MTIRSRAMIATASLALVGASAPNPPAYRAPEHHVDNPLYTSSKPRNLATADAGAQLEIARPARWALGEHRKLERQLAGLTPQRKGVVDAYVISIALDSDPVFGREAREAGKVLARRYDAEGRTIVLAGSDGSGDSPYPAGSPENLAAALARVAEVMDPKEDVLILYTTSHGAPVGIVYQDADNGFGLISPKRLAGTLQELGIRNRLLIVSACFAGIFVPPLASDTTAILTAASSKHTSFGCVSDNDWTFFGDAMINHALRQPQPLAAAAAQARVLIGEWEAKGKLIASGPQTSIGKDVASWLGPLEARSPATATPAVGRPAVLALGEASENNH